MKLSSCLLMLFFGGTTSCASQSNTHKISSPLELTDSAEIGSKLLKVPADLASMHGAGKLQLLASGVGVAGDVISSLLAIPDGQCGLFLGRGSPGVKDLDLLAFSDDGSLIAADEARDDVPTLLLCPADGERVFISARVAAGKGIVALGVQTVSRSSAFEVAEVIGARGLLPETPATLGSWPNLELSIREHQEELGIELTEVKSLTLPVDSRMPTRISASIRAHHCFSFLALPSTDIGFVDLELEDQQGRIIARGKKRKSERWLLVCAGSQTQVVHLSLRPHLGRGLVALMMSESQRAVEEIEVLKDFDPIYLGGTPASEALLKLPSLSLKTGELTLKTLSISGCAQVELKPRAPLLDFKVTFWSESGRLLGRSQGRSARTTTICASGLVRMDAEARLKGGPLHYRLGLISSFEPSTQALLEAHPLATGSLLNLANTFSGTSSTPNLAEIHVEKISASLSLRRDITVKTGQCLTQVAVTSTGKENFDAPLGLRLLALDSRTGEILKSDLHNQRAILKICSGEGERKVRIEFSVNEGSGWLLHYSSSAELDSP